MHVLFPAPFSPSKESTSPLFTENETSLLAITFEKYLEIELSKNKLLQQLQIQRRNEIMEEQANNTQAMQKTISK